MELKQVSVPVSHELLHGSRELPTSFVAWIALADTVLPAKGLELRRYDRDTPKKDSGDTKADTVCAFVLSDWWRYGGLDPRTAPRVIQESGCQLPDEDLRSNMGHRSYTDFQQTAQWLGGVECPHAILSQLIKGVLPKDGVAVVHNITPYDGCLERAVISLRDAGHPLLCISTTSSSVLFNFVFTSVKTCLVEARPCMPPVSLYACTPVYHVYTIVYLQTIRYHSRRIAYL